MEEGRSRQVHRGAGLALGAQGEEQLLMGSDSAGLRQSLQSENRYLKDRVRSCEKGLLTLYQLLHPGDPPSSSPSKLARCYQPSPHQLFRPPNHVSAENRQVTIDELRECIVRLVRERRELVCEVEEQGRRVEACRRERLQALEERDHHLHSAHLLRVELEGRGGRLEEAEGERDRVAARARDLETQLCLLQKANEEANLTRMRVLEERSRLLAELDGVKSELVDLRYEHRRALEEKAQLRLLVQEIEADRRLREAQLDSLQQQFGLMDVGRKGLKAKGTSDQSREVVRVVLKRRHVSEQWGWRLAEGGKEASLVVADTLPGSPAHDLLLAGDILYSLNSHSLMLKAQKDIRSVMSAAVDKLSLAVEVLRCSHQPKPRSICVHLPGRKPFGFSYHSRLFVSELEEGSVAKPYLLPGDEIIKVMGKPAVNMKRSHLKQLLKSCKDGITMEIQRHPLVDQVAGGRFSWPEHDTEMHPYPETPVSTLSDSSTGYHSAHSLPSMLSSPLSPQTHVPKRNCDSIQSGATGYESDQTSQTGCHSHSLGSLALLGSSHSPASRPSSYNRRLLAARGDTGGSSAHEGTGDADLISPGSSSRIGSEVSWRDRSSHV